VGKGIKKEGPTVRELQEEYGGAGIFYIPLEEHYLLEKDEWKYDKPPQFYLGKNVADYYDPDIERKLAELEAEEDKLLELEGLGEMEEEEGEVGLADLERAVKEVRGKKSILKMQHKLKRNLRAKSKNKNIKDLEEHLERLGLNPNKESLQKRVKARKSIAELEANQDKLAKKVIEQEGEEEEKESRGRKRKRALSSDDEHMEEAKSSKEGKRAVSALKIRSQSKARALSQGRREGSKPKRLAYKEEPEEYAKLARKITKRFKHSININEADRTIGTKMPKHLFSGKRSNSKNDRR